VPPREHSPTVLPAARAVVISIGEISATGIRRLFRPGGRKKRDRDDE
jgi:hypothetical protein